MFTAGILAQAPDHGLVLGILGFGHAALGDASLACVRWRRAALQGPGDQLHAIQLWQSLGFDSAAATPEWAAYVRDMAELRARMDALY